MTYVNPVSGTGSNSQRGWEDVSIPKTGFLSHIWRNSAFLLPLRYKGNNLGVYIVPNSLA